MLPFAPGRVSERTCCPHVSVSFAPTSRTRMSDVPPGGAPTSIRIGLDGHGGEDGAGVCAYERLQKHDTVATAAVRAFISSLLLTAGRRLLRPGERGCIVSQGDAGASRDVSEEFKCRKCVCRALRFRSTGSVQGRIRRSSNRWAWED